MTLTKLETALIRHLGNEGAACTGAENAEQMRDDFMAFDFFDASAKALGLNKNQAGGVVTSLLSKSLIELDVNPTSSKMELWLDREEGVDAYYDILKNEQEG